MHEADLHIYVDLVHIHVHGILGIGGIVGIGNIHVGAPGIHAGALDTALIMPCALGVVGIVLLSYYLTVHISLSCILATASNSRFHKLICLLTQPHVCLCAMLIN